MQRGRGIAEAVLSAALFGMATPASKPLLAHFPPQILAGLFYLGAAIVLAPGVLARRAKGRPVLPSDLPNRRRLLGAVVFGGLLGPVLLLAGLAQARAASVAMWLNLETVATAVLGVLLFREQLGRWTWAGNLAVFAAGLLLAWEGGASAWRAGVLVAGAAVCWGLDNNLTALVDGIGPADTTFWKGAAAGTTNLVFGVAIAGVPAAGSPWGLALVLGAASYGASIALYIAAAQRIGAVRSQMIFATAPAFGIVGALLWLGESMAPLQWIAAAVLAGANLLLLLDRHAHEHEHEPMEHEHEHRHDDGHHDHEHPGLPPETRHSHRHAHGRRVHAHPHWPDLHHRHDHR